jgi:hypothetical protein
MPLLVGGVGLSGSLAIGLSTGGVASAAGQSVSGTYSCATPLGTKKVPVTIHDLNTAPATLPQGTIYIAQPQVVATIPSSLIKTAHTATGTLTSLAATMATLNITATGFQGPSKITATNMPLTVPINTTTEKNGASITINYNAADFTVTATSGTAKLIPGDITLHVVVTLTCFPPSEKITDKTATTVGKGYTVSGSDTLGPFDSLTATAAVKPITRTWEVAADGGVFAFGNAHYFGSMGGKPLNAPVVGMAATPTGGGYWLVAADGGVFAFGNAHYYGSMGGKHLNAPIVGMAAAPTGSGYWLVAADGGVFAFGTAQFHGSMVGKALNEPIAGIAATPTGKGYWLVAADGGIFAFGTAKFDGSLGGQPLNETAVGVASTVTGKGYWETTADGAIFAFGAAKPYGSEAGLQLNAPVVGVAATPTGNGYWEVAADGGIFPFGTARLYGSEAGQHLNEPIVGMAAT